MDMNPIVNKEYLSPSDSDSTKLVAILTMLMKWMVANIVISKE